MELSNAESGGIFDHHDGGIWDIDANLNDGGGDEDLNDAGSKVLHDPPALIGSQLAMQHHRSPSSPSSQARGSAALHIETMDCS